MAQLAQQSPQASEQEPASQELHTESFTGSVSNEQLKEAVDRVEELEDLEATFTPCLDAAWKELEGCADAVDDFDVETLASTGLELVDDVVGADDARVLPPLTQLEKGVIERDGSTVIEDYGTHAAPWAEFLDAVPSGLPAWAADLDEDGEADDGVVDTIVRFQDTLADVIVAQDIVELCDAIRGDDEAGQEALRTLVTTFHNAPDALRPYLMEAIEAQRLGELHIHNFLLGVEQADLLAEMEAEEAVLEEKVDAFEVTETGSGFTRAVGDLVELLGGRARTEFEAEGSLNIPVVGPVSVVGGAKLTVSHGVDDYKATLHFEGGVGVGKPGKAGASIAAGYTLEAKGRSGVQVANLFQLGLRDTLESCKEEPPPYLFDLLVRGSLFQLAPGLGAAEAGQNIARMVTGKGRRSFVWEAIADAFLSPKKREELIEAMEDGDYVETFDQLLVKGEVGKEGAGAKGHIKGGIVRRIEQRQGKLHEADWIGIKAGDEVAVGNDEGITAKFEMKDVIGLRWDAPPDTSAEVKLAIEGSVESGSLEGMDVLFGEAGLSALAVAFAAAGAKDEHKEQLAGMPTLLAQAKGMTSAALAEKGLKKSVGVTLGIEVEAAFATRKGTWTVAAALVSKIEGDAEVAKGALQRKESLGEIEIDPSSPAT